MHISLHFPDMDTMKKSVLPQDNSRGSGNSSSKQIHIDEEMTLQAIKSSFSSLGDSAYRALVYHIRCDYGVSEIDLARDELLLESTLVSLLGPGAGMLFELIDKELTRLCDNAND